MRGPSTLDLAVGALSFVLMLAWGTLAADAWGRVRKRRGLPTFARLGAVLTSALTAIYFSTTVFAVVPAHVHMQPPRFLLLLFAFNDAAVFCAVAVFRHWTHFFTVRLLPTSRGWVAANYGGMAAMVLLSLGIRAYECVAGFGLHSGIYQVLNWLYVLAMLVLSLTAIARHARGPDWRAGSTSVPRRPDVLVLAAAVACAAVIVILHALGGWQNYASLLNPLALLIGFVVLIPFAVRNLGGLIVALLTNLCTLAGLGTIGGGAGLLAARLGPDLRLVPVVVAAAALVVVTGVGRRALHDAIDAIVFRRTRDRWARLTALLRGISPEAGTLECARRALDALVREAHLRASALLFRDGAAVVSGDLDLGRVARLWPKGEAADALLARASYHDDLQILPAELREATIDANIVCIAPIRGSRRPWGHLVLSTDLVGSTFFDEDIQGIEAFNAQLALIFDAADMLERVVAVERSLAHAEKLAAIGELAARIAHEIRNPVTAARSLAQTLSREPTSPLNAEHAELILTELERVERQVAALLRFARREEFHFENADVGSLVRETAQHFEARLAGANVGCTVDAPDGIVARVDRDKLRQVLINLVENALDAVADRAGERRIALTVSARNGSSTVRVEDSGPGIPEDALARIFEPFFSLKAQGTGLGLAIVKRTVEAHGGRVHASSSRDGAAFEIELPLMNPTGVPRSGGRA